MVASAAAAVKLTTVFAWAWQESPVQPLSGEKSADTGGAGPTTTVFEVRIRQPAALQPGGATASTTL